MLLVLFSVSYYSVIYYYGFTTAREAITYMLLLPVMYWIGCSVSWERIINWPIGVTWILLAMIAGFVLFSYLSTNQNYTLNDIFENEYYKEIGSYWNSELMINRPGLGAFASLGICLFPALFLGVASVNKIERILFKSAILIIFMVGMMTNLILANRAPFISLVIAILVSFTVNHYLMRRANKSLLITYMLSGIVVCILGISFVLFLPQTYIFERFAAEGVGTSRVDAWISMLSHLFIDFWGGRVTDLAGNPFVHNLWLDVAWDAGLIPFILLLMFHASHIKNIKTVFQSRNMETQIIFIFCIGISFFTNFMQEPTMAASALYFAASCFFLGVVQRLSLDIL